MANEVKKTKATMYRRRDIVRGRRSAVVYLPAMKLPAKSKLVARVKKILCLGNEENT
jgi:hypothetical protein